MSTMEIALLVIGVIIFALSFLIPDKKNSTVDTIANAEDIKRLVDSEINGMKLKVNEATDETVEYSIEKAERQLERVSNEKIMALSEYADTIMEGIDKNHQELLFMYDMLSDKQTDLKNTVRKAEEAAREVESIPIPQTVTPTQPEVSVVEEPSIAPVMVQTSDESDTFVQMVSSMHTVDEYIDEPYELSDNGNVNNNDRIIEMSKKGMSTVDIARELGLGVGEVKLVIDLFKD